MRRRTQAKGNAAASHIKSIISRRIGLARSMRPRIERSPRSDGEPNLYGIMLPPCDRRASSSHLWDAAWCGNAYIRRESTALVGRLAVGTLWLCGRRRPAALRFCADLVEFSAVSADL